MRDKGVYETDNLPAGSLFSVAFAAGSVRTELKVFRETRLSFPTLSPLYRYCTDDDTEISNPSDEWLLWFDNSVQDNCTAENEFTLSMVPAFSGTSRKG